MCRSELATGVLRCADVHDPPRAEAGLAEVAPLFRRFLDENPWTRLGVAGPGVDCQRSRLCRRRRERRSAEMARAGFAFPADAKRSLTLSYLAEVCTRPAMRSRPSGLYEQLLPYRDNAILAPGRHRVLRRRCTATSACSAGVDGRMDARPKSISKRHSMMDERLHAWPWLAHTKHEFALALDRTGPMRLIRPCG